MGHLLFPLILVGMSGPSIAALTILFQANNKNLLDDFYQRLYLSRIKIHFIPIVLLCMPCLVLSAIAISLLFGQSIDQFLSLDRAPDQSLQGINIIGMLIILFMACSLEEIGWRGYGIDSLHIIFNLWHTSLIFACIWSLWHVPAFFIQHGYFQQEVLSLGWLAVAIYFLSLFPVTVVMNWVYIKNNRSILIVILFHMVMNLSYGLFHMQLVTKMILMILLFIVAGIIVLRDKKLFFKSSKNLPIKS